MGNCLFTHKPVRKSIAMPSDYEIYEWVYGYEWRGPTHFERMSTFKTGCLSAESNRGPSLFT